MLIRPGEVFVSLLEPKEPWLWFKVVLTLQTLKEEKGDLSKLLFIALTQSYHFEWTDSPGITGHLNYHCHSKMEYNY